MDLKQINKQGQVTVPEMFTFQEIMQKSSVNRIIMVTQMLVVKVEMIAE